jgi:hypothetical protein
MADARGDLRLANEALGQRGVIHRERGGKNLERNLDLEGLVIGQVDGADAAAPEFTDDPATSDHVARFDFADHRGHHHYD